MTNRKHNHGLNFRILKYYSVIGKVFGYFKT